MPSFRTTVTVPANGQINNVMEGSAFRFARGVQNVEVAATQAAGAGTVVADVQFGPQLQLESGSISDEIGAGQGPRIPDNTIVGDVAAPGDEIIIRLRETAGLATGVTVFIRTEPLG